MTGRISLYKGGSIVATRSYRHNPQKNLILSAWKKIYGKGFKKCEVRDQPDPKKNKPGSFKKGSITNKYKFNKPSTKAQYDFQN